MAEFTRQLFLKALEEWGRYPEAFNSLLAERQAEFLQAQGYDSLRDLLGHVAAWWEEGRGIISETIQHGARPGRKYDLDEFNAAAVQRFKDMPEAGFFSWYEQECKRMLDVVSALTDAQLQIPKIPGWLDAVVLEHLKIHGIGAPRFLVSDMLQREWAEAVKRFKGLDAEQQATYLAKQGFLRFQDLLAHVIAWWEQGIGVIEKSSSDDETQVEDVDAFNAQAVQRFSGLEEAQVLGRYEDTRLTLVSLIDMLPDEVLAKPKVQTSLKADVIDHYFEHAF